MEFILLFCYMLCKKVPMEGCTQIVDIMANKNLFKDLAIPLLMGFLKIKEIEFKDSERTRLRKIPNWKKDSVTVLREMNRSQKFIHTPVNGSNSGI